MLQEYVRFTVTLLAVLDPFLAIPIFLAFTADAQAAERTRLVHAVVLTVFLVLAGAAIVGEPLLKLVGASLPAFTVGGGLVLLLMALAMLNAEAGKVRQNPEEAAELRSRDLSGVVPLAVPLLAGPGAISTTIIAAQKGGAAHVGALIACIFAVCALLWLVLRLAQRIGERISTTGLNIATRLFGLILAAIAIEMIAEGMRTLLPGLA
ncbi:MAG: NAAT family transporter [Betaproteobacteria bacterium]|nr:NAAT family transporter [Betaproteobacteria bacterium]